MKKIVLVQYGSDSEIMPLLSLVIGLSKKYPKHHIVWVGEPSVFELIKYNKRIHSVIDITQEFDLSTLQNIIGCEICVNVSFTKVAREFTSKVITKLCFGFNKDGPINRTAEFFHKVANHDLTTKKSVLQLYYDLANLRWKGEGYGLSYYPRSKQTKKCGQYQEQSIPDCTEIKKPKKILPYFDMLNQFARIMTDDLFTAHASIALRKECIFSDNSLPYRMEFFGRGSIKTRGKLE